MEISGSNGGTIGVFDSGLGGLTAVRELSRILPCEDIVYFGDTGRVPYGTRSVSIIRRYTSQDINFLVSKGVKIVVAACGTASSVVTDEMVLTLKEKDILYTGVIEPASLKASRITKTKKVGVIATNASINSGAYNKAIARYDKDITVIGVPCPLFVPLVENGYTERDNTVTKIVANDYLKAFTGENKVDTLILGCTHYPVIKDIIADIMGDEVTLVDTGKEAAAYVKLLLEERALLNKSDTVGRVNYYVSDSVDSFADNARVILKETAVGEVKKLDIEKY